MNTIAEFVHAVAAGELPMPRVVYLHSADHERVVAALAKEGLPNALYEQSPYVPEGQAVVSYAAPWAIAKTLLAEVPR